MKMYCNVPEKGLILPFLQNKGIKLSQAVLDPLPASYLPYMPLRPAPVTSPPRHVFLPDP